MTKIKVKWTKEKPVKPGWYAAINTSIPNAKVEIVDIGLEQFDHDEDGNLFYWGAWYKDDFRSVEPIEIEVPV